MDFYAKKYADRGYVSRMSHAGCYAELRRANRLKDDGHTHGLPSGHPVPVFPIAALPGSPNSWVREAGTYVCPVDTGWGLWFDWTMNESLNTAIVPSVKGMNPVTGRKLEGMGLEQYSDKCPIHDEPFAHGRLCEKCGYEWPPQNYVCSPNTLWWDGFRQPDGVVRQFFFTDEDERDIASLVIGKKNTVPAFGFAFYRPKNPRTAPKSVYRGVMGQNLGLYGQTAKGVSTAGPEKQWQFPSTPRISATYSAFAVNTPLAAQASCDDILRGDGDEDDVLDFASSEMMSSVDESSAPAQRPRKMATSPKKSKDVAVGAGAKIAQDLDQDNLGLDGWLDKEVAVIRLYFCFESQLREIIDKGGVKDLKSNKEGFLKELPVG